MQTYSLGHLSDPVLLRALDSLDAQDRTTTAAQLAHLAEVDSRKLYVPAGYPSMFAYCVGKRGYSDDVAAKRIQAARVARRFPAILPALADGRLHLSAVVLLAPHLTEDTAAELMAAATHQSKSEIERLLAARFPVSDMLAWVAAMPVSPAGRSFGEHAPGHVENKPAPAHVVEEEHAPGHVQAQQAPGPGERSRVKPLSSESFAVQFTLGRSDHDRLCYAQDLLSHEIPSGDLAGVFVRALDLLIPELERRKFAATERPREGRKGSDADTRHIPASVKRTVWERDGGRCTFVSEGGHRCEARKLIEFDHVEEFARGGEATVAGIRLLCRAHNQHEAERTFGPEFMRNKRIAAAEARAAAKLRASTAMDQEVAAARAQAAVAAGP